MGTKESSQAGYNQEFVVENEREIATMPSFTTIDVKQFPQQLETLLSFNLKQINNILSSSVFTWENLIQALEDIDDKLERFWSPLAHLHSVVNSKALRTCYQSCLPKLTEYESTIGHNEALFNAINSLDFQQLNEQQQKIVNDMLLGFKLSGVNLPKDKKIALEKIQQELSALSNQFENNVLDATQGFSILVSKEEAERLRGIPEHAVHTAREKAEEGQEEGWCFTLDFPSYAAVITYADDRNLRETIYKAYITRASDQGPNANRWDNTHVIQDLLKLRKEKANLLGFSNYAELSLATKMAKSSAEVSDFLNDLCIKSFEQAKQEFNELKDFSAQSLGIHDLQPWDMAYCSEKKKVSSYQISKEDLRPYFPQEKVMAGLFEILKRLYGMSVKEIKGVDSWHPDVKCYFLYDEKSKLRGAIYVDLYARLNKRDGAWMDSFQTRRKLPNGELQHPIASLTCNFAKPTSEKQATLSHDEVETLFHEFGHCLHHILTQVDYYHAAGINGVEWDAVELPSQFFENWCWEKEALDLLTEHWATKEPLPNELFQKMIAAKNFQSALAMMRQLEFSCFDFKIHEEFKPNSTKFASKIISEVRQQTRVVPTMDNDRFQNTFSHIFAGGYAAGYYSYKWAEVLSSDAFSRFEEEGLFNEKTGRDFLHSILEVGGSKNAAQAFQTFRGRLPQVEALLRHNGIKTTINVDVANN